MKQAYLNYYLQFMGASRVWYESGSEFGAFVSSQRDIPMCRKYYHTMIYSRFCGRRILSAGQQISQYLCHTQIKFSLEAVLDLGNDTEKEILIFLKNQLPAYKVRSMLRMGLRSMRKIHNENVMCMPQAEGKQLINEARALKPEEEMLFLNSLLKDGVEPERIRLKWKEILPYVSEGRWFVHIQDGKIVARAYISDLDFNGGNIAVWTDPDYRRKGYGRAVTAQAVRWCLEHKVLPVYLVEKENFPSLKTARSLGFETMFEEIIVSGNS